MGKKGERNIKDVDITSRRWGPSAITAYRRGIALGASGEMSSAGGVFGAKRIHWKSQRT